MKPVRTWILIADGARARVVLNDGPGHGLRDIDALQFEADTPPARDIMADRPGRTFDSGGDGRHAMEPASDPARARKRAFLDEVASVIDAKLSRKAFDRLIVVAPPAALGDLRASLSAQVKKTVTAEIDKDLTKIKTRDLDSHLKDVLAP